MNEEELLKKLRQAFKMESEERLASISNSLLELEKISEPEKQKPVLEVIFREAHSLKGAARAVNLTDVENLCQSVESIFSALKEGNIPVSVELFDTLYDSIRIIEKIITFSETVDSHENKKEIEQIIYKLEFLKLNSKKNDELESGIILDFADDLEQNDFIEDTFYQEKPEKEALDDSEKITCKTDDEMKNSSLPDTQKIPDPLPNLKPLISETIRISTAKLDSLLLEAEELSSLKLVSSQRLINLRDIMHFFENWKKQWNKTEPEYRVLRDQVQKQRNLEKREARKASSLSKLLEFTEQNQEHLQYLERIIRTLKKAAEQEHRTLSRMVDELLDDMKKVMMLPFSTLFDIFPRMIRDISKNQGKEADLVVEGSDIEIDRRILEEMKDPLIHLLRNAIDHGLEKPENRTKLNKPRCGTIRLTVSQTESNKVEILVSDDGRGVDFEEVKKEAVKTKLISEKDAEQLKYQDAISFIFRSGFSSSQIITEISGRGLGLAIVEEKVEQIGGFLSVDATPGKGTTFKIQVPVTLATFRGVLIQVAEMFFIVPGLYMERILRINQDEIKTVENRATISLNGQVLPFIDLAGVLQLEIENQKSKFESQNVLTVMVLGSGKKQVAFRIDEVICEQEVLVKSLGKQLARVPYIAGATILGTGKVVPILNVHDLLKSPVGSGLIWSSGKGTAEESASGRQESPVSKGNILVAEDSITSRILIKNILEASGYSVKTAVDGRNAYSMLKTEPFDIVVSDVEMPGMDGFELTEKIRSDARIAELPVVLVTSLDSPEDRERGIDAGADAYIVKSSFDQSNLLEVISRLI